MRKKTSKLFVTKGLRIRHEMAETTSRSLVGFIRPINGTVCVSSLLAPNYAAELVTNQIVSKRQNSNMRTPTRSGQFLFTVNVSTGKRHCQPVVTVEFERRCSSRRLAGPSRLRRSGRRPIGGRSRLRLAANAQPNSHFNRFRAVKSSRRLRGCEYPAGLETSATGAPTRLRSRTEGRD